ncbi:MAG TPA: limonene-1,2-epoxide hydrolase family protein [Polyangiaceae bacterium]|jgi:limonene-1,2-epoxide hydrolase|nr:limonene-1,2-epoxide hydrolase family protein [Polyangiaceae bacterium]
MENPSAAAGTSSAIAVVEAFLRALELLDLDGAAELLADEVVYQNVPLPADRGKEATMKTLRLFMRFGDHFEARIHNIAERDGIVLTERTDVLGTRAAPLTIWVCGTFEVRGGKIVLWRDYFDIATFLVQATKVFPAVALHFAKSLRSAG